MSLSPVPVRDARRSLRCQPAGPPDDDQPPDAAPTRAAAEAALAEELTCSGPISASDTAVPLQQRFAGQARWETLDGPEGSQFPGLVLWPANPAQRVEVIFVDEGARTVSSAAVKPGSQWRVAVLALGDTMARTSVVNGKPFKLWGFSWDYGGYVSDLGGGKLAGLPGGCRVTIRFGPPEAAEVPDALIGEVEVSSDDPRLEAVGETIDELSLAF